MIDLAGDMAKKFVNSVGKRGILATIALPFKYPLYLVQKLYKTRFEVKYGTDTHDIESFEVSHADLENIEYAKRYKLCYMALVQAFGAPFTRATKWVSLRGFGFRKGACFAVC